MSFDVPLRRAACLAAASLALVLAGCGGGGDSAATPAVGATATAVTATLLAPSSTLENQCTPEAEKRWVRSYVDETYLWYDEVPPVDATSHDNARAVLSTRCSCAAPMRTASRATASAP